MITSFRRKDRQDLLRTPIVQQTAFWSEVKTEMGIAAMAFHFSIPDNQVNESQTNTRLGDSDILVLVKKVDKDSSIAYVPYGPEYEPCTEDHGVFLEELSECIRPFLPADCLMIRYDLSWESMWANDSDYYRDGKWTGPPDKKFQEIRFNFNTVKWNLRKSSVNNLPSSTVFIDLKSDLFSIRKAMKPKTRYNIELAKRKGVHVQAVSIENLELWYELYKATALRNRLFLHGIDYFRTVLNIHPQNTQSPADVFLLVAMYENMPLAAMFLVLSGDRGTYLYGASASHHRNLMASYALQWHAVKLAKEKNCTEYDMFGISPQDDPAHPLYGLYRFKTGFGGKILHTLGCWDYPFHEETYSFFSAAELKSQGYHLN